VLVADQRQPAHDGRAPRWRPCPRSRRTRLHQMSRLR
jgi:hypothetical protein